MPYFGSKPAATILTSANIADNSITSAKVVDGVIVAADIGSNAVTTAKLGGNLIAPGDFNISTGNTFTIDSGATITNSGSE